MSDPGDHDFGELAAEIDDDGVRFVITRIDEEGAEIVAAVDMSWDEARKLAYSLLSEGGDH